MEQNTVLRLHLHVPNSFVFVCQGRVCMVVLLCNGLDSHVKNLAVPQVHSAFLYVLLTTFSC